MRTGRNMIKMLRVSRVHPNRIQLAPVRRSDLPQLFNWINDPESVRHNAGYKPVHYTTHEVWFKLLASRADMHLFAIRTSRGGRLLGTCQLHSIHPVHRNAELQIRLGRAADRGRGYGSEAMHLLLAFAFHDLNLERVYLHVFSTNTRAIRTYERAGFRREGLLRRSVFIGGQWDDLVVMGILRDEFVSPGRAVSRL